MLEALKDMKDSDAIFFIPHEEEDNLVNIKAAGYKDKGEKIGGSSIGDLYDIIVFRLSEEYDITDLDKFEGILIDPRYYISRMVKEDWYGLVAKKTTTSNTFVQDVFDNWSKA
jgi:hypothetical protein